MRNIATHSDARSWIAPAVITVAAVACYANSFAGTFVYDDRQHVANNPALHQLWPPYDWLGYCPTRPVVYFTFALNYAFGGENVFGYHLMNLLIHMAVAWALFGFARRALQRPVVGESYRRRADLIAGVIALIWVVHPLCTQAVTYVYQRLESLAALFAVLACYALARAYEQPKKPQRKWLVASWLCCAAGMLSKESVAALPIILLLYDRIFLADSWRGVLTRRRVHLAMFCTWGLALGPMIATGDAYGKSGIAEVPGLTPWTYLISQSGVLLRYLRLTVWPSGQCLDYGWPPAENWDQYVPQGIIILSLFIATCVGVYRGRTWSFPAAAFFLLLAPTSSIIPIADLIFEHRMYLPSACVVALGVCAGVRGLDFAAQYVTASASVYRCAALLVCVVVAGLGTATVLRNRLYHDELDLWQDILVKAPQNPRGPYLLGGYYLHKGDRKRAESYFKQCLQVSPLFVPAYAQRTELLMKEGRHAEAEADLTLLESALPFEPIIKLHAASLYTAFGNLRMDQQRYNEAVQYYAQAVDADPRADDAMNNLALALANSGRHAESLELYRQMAAARPDDPSLQNNLGVVLRNNGQLEAAAAAFRAAVELDPKSSEPRANLGSILELQGRGDEALAELLRAAEMDDRYIGAQINLGTALARRGRFAEALKHLQKAVEIDPTNATAQANLQQVQQDLAAVGQGTSAPAAP